MGGGDASSQLVTHSKNPFGSHVQEVVQSLPVPMLPQPDPGEQEAPCVQLVTGGGGGGQEPTLH
jgi:hypothetical protein